MTDFNWMFYEGDLVIDSPEISLLEDNNLIITGSLTLKTKLLEINTCRLFVLKDLYVENIYLYDIGLYVGGTPI